MDESGAARDVRVAVAPGRGRLTRRGRTLLFVPDVVLAERGSEVDELFARFHRDGPAAAADSNLSRCLIDWSSEMGHVAFDSNFDLWVTAPRDDDNNAQHHPVTLGRWVDDRSDPCAERLVVVSDATIDALGTPTDLRDGDVYAGGFGLVFRTTPASISLTTPELSQEPADVTAEPPQFVGLTDLDVTLTPAGPVHYPDDDTDRTFRRPGDIRCPRGHANANTNETCRVCGESLDSTASRAGPRASTALAGVRLPDGSVIPINRSIAIGRSPSAQGARLDGSARLVAIDAPGTVSRTHVLLQLDRGNITVTDCEARGRTAVVSADDPVPVALTPWEPRNLAIGDIIQLGGPTTLTITDPAELRVPASLEPTAPPPKRDETT